MQIKYISRDDENPVTPVSDKYDEIFGYNGGVAKVVKRLRDPNGALVKKYNYVDENDNLLLGSWFDNVRDFEDGHEYALVARACSYSYDFVTIKRKTKPITREEYYQLQQEISDAHDSNSPEENEKFWNEIEQLEKEYYSASEENKRRVFRYQYFLVNRKGEFFSNYPFEYVAPLDDSIECDTAREQTINDMFERETLGDYLIVGTPTGRPKGWAFYPDCVYNILDTRDGYLISRKWFDNLYRTDHIDMPISVQMSPKTDRGYKDYGNTKYNFITLDGELISDKWYDGASPFGADGLAIVRKRPTRYHKNDSNDYPNNGVVYNVIKRDGTLIRDEWFDFATREKRGRGALSIYVKDEENSNMFSKVNPDGSLAAPVAFAKCYADPYYYKYPRDWKKRKRGDVE